MSVTLYPSYVQTQALVDFMHRAASGEDKSHINDLNIREAITMCIQHAQKEDANPAMLSSQVIDAIGGPDEEWSVHVTIAVRRCLPAKAPRVI